jgi:hypothetical protein
LGEVFTYLPDLIVKSWDYLIAEPATFSWNVVSAIPDLIVKAWNYLLAEPASFSWDVLSAIPDLIVVGYTRHLYEPVMFVYNTFAGLFSFSDYLFGENDPVSTTVSYGTFINDVFDALPELLSYLWNNLTPQFTESFSFAGDVLGGIPDLITVVWTWFTSHFTFVINAFDAIPDLVTYFISEGEGSGMNIFDFIAAVFEALPDTLIKWWNHYDTYLTFMRDVLEAFPEWWNSWFDELTTKVWNQFYQGFTLTGSTLYYFPAFIVDAANDIGDWFESVFASSDSDSSSDEPSFWDELAEGWTDFWAGIAAWNVSTFSWVMIGLAITLVIVLLSFSCCWEDVFKDCLSNGSRKKYMEEQKALKKKLVAKIEETQEEGPA